jgi:hypothetical protein
MKENVAVIIVVALVIALVGMCSKLKLDSLDDNRVIAEMVQQVEIVEKDRAMLRDSLKLYDSLLNVQKTETSMLKEKLAMSVRELSKERQRNRDIIDSIGKIPADTVYRHISARFPNSLNEPLTYPFAAGQIKPMYSAVIRGAQLEDEYNILFGVYGDCQKYSTSLYKENEILQNSLILSKADRKKADVQRDLYWNQVQRLNNKNANLRLWRKLTTGAAVVLGFIAIVK